MKQIKTHIKTISIVFLLLGSTTQSFGNPNDVYFIFYATIDGKSGHAGIAVDNYKIVVKEDRYNENNERISVYDTVKDGTLTYYDLWPVKDDFDAISVSKDYKPRYYELPTSSWEDDITVYSLLEKGIPHEEGYPVDGLLKFSTSPVKDNELKVFIAAEIAKNRPFNAREFNCADFVELIIEYLCKCKINAEEYIVFRYSTTPNKLYQRAAALDNVKIIKNGAEKAKGSFTMERLLKKKKE